MMAQSALGFKYEQEPRDTGMTALVLLNLAGGDSVDDIRILENDEGFGRIEFAIGCDVTPEFKKAVSEVSESDWHPFVKRVNGREIETGKHLALDASWAPRRMKAIRFGLINIAARVIQQSRYLKVRLCRGHGLFRWFTDIRIRIALLKPVPPG